MASITTALRPPSEWQIAKALSGVLPSELSHSPVLGIIGVVMGAGIVTLAGRLLSLGTADLKGSLGISYDDGSWLGTAFNVALKTHFIAIRERIHSNLLGLHVQRGEWVTDASVRQLTAGLYGKSSGLSSAAGRAVDLLGARVRLQAYTLSFIDGFHLVEWACVLALLLTLVLRKSPLDYEELGFGPRESKRQPGGSKA